MKIATWNVNSIRARLNHLQSWLETHNPDILAIQETKVIDDDFPEKAIRDLGYYTYYSGQKSYNGVATISKTAAENLSVTFPGYDETQKRYIGLSVGDLRIINAYVPNGSDIGTDKYDYKLNWLSAFSKHVANELIQHTNVVVLGDFNIAPSNLDVYNPEECEGQILCSDLERSALLKLMDTTLTDVFRQLSPEKQAFSWWDYRGGAFRQNKGLRIDLILASKSLTEGCTYCDIDREPRMLEKPSDHAPVIALFTN